MKAIVISTNSRPAVVVLTRDDRAARDYITDCIGAPVIGVHTTYISHSAGGITKEYRILDPLDLVS